MDYEERGLFIFDGNKRFLFEFKGDPHNSKYHWNRYDEVAAALINHLRFLHLQMFGVDPKVYVLPIGLNLAQHVEKHVSQNVLDTERYYWDDPVDMQNPEVPFSVSTNNFGQCGLFYFTDPFKTIPRR